MTSRINAALNKFKDYGLIEETELSGQPAVQPQLMMLVMVPRDELERFSGLIGDLIGSGRLPEGDEDGRPGGNDGE